MNEQIIDNDLRIVYYRLCLDIDSLTELMVNLMF